MIKAYQTVTEMEANVVKSIFAENGIDSTIKNQNISNIAGEVPFTESYVEIWVEEDADLEKITTLLEEYQKLKIENNSDETWLCSSCQEENAVSFELCWQCQSPSPTK